MSADELLARRDIDLVAIATRHDSHARLAGAALQAGKHVFVEKPPGLSADELHMLRDLRDQTGLRLAVGFNRRHAAASQAARAQVRGDRAHGPIEILYRVAAGPLPPDHWLLDVNEGGGPLVGEGCHFVDFACWMVGALPTRVNASFGRVANSATRENASFRIGLEFDGGSFASIVYTPAAAKGVGKEYVELHGSGRSAFIDDYRRVKLAPGRTTRGRSKGHEEQFQHFRQVLTGSVRYDEPDPLDTMAVTLACAESAESGTGWLSTQDILSRSGK